MNARLLQLASPALPIGGFSYSSALEWGIESGQVHDERGGREWIEDAVSLNLARFEAPLMVTALRILAGTDGIVAPPSVGPELWVGVSSVMQAAGLPGPSGHPGLAGPSEPMLARLAALNEQALAARETSELRQETTQMGYSLGRWVVSVCGAGSADEVLCERLQPLGLPVAWALAAVRLGLDEGEAALGLVWSFVENQVMVLMKALPLGQVAAQRMLLALGRPAEAAARRACRLEPDDWCSAAPALALASMKHETQYSRLFRS
jgi:urease accessory protein